MIEKKYITDGIFGKKEICINVKINSKTKVLYILLHGAYGKVYHTTPTIYEKLSELIAKKYSVGFYQTSRWFMQMDRPELDYDQYREQSFGGKSFAEEQGDVSHAVREIIRSYNDIVGSMPEQIILVGFSMGGVMAALLSNKIKFVSKIYAFGSGIKFLLPNTYPLFRDFPTSTKIASSIRSYNGEFHVIHGALDDLTTLRSSAQLYNCAKSASIRTLIEWLGVNHQFTSINGEPAEDLLISRIMKMIC